MFTGIVAYADDIALLTPTPQAMRCMLSICEKYAAEFGVMLVYSLFVCLYYVCFFIFLFLNFKFVCMCLCASSTISIIIMFILCAF